MKFVGYIVYLYLRFVFATTRWHMQGYDAILKNEKESKAQIFAFWHGRIAMMSSFKPFSSQTYVMVSRHTDGEWISTVLRCYGLEMVRGSSRRAGSNKERGGRHALVQAVKRLKEKNNVAMTPDGPRGPRQRVSGMITEIAGMGGAVVVPMSFSTQFAITFNSWDRFLLPLPFGKGWYMVAAPIEVPANANAETLAKLKQKIEDELNRLTAEVDRKAGRVSPTPA